MTNTLIGVILTSKHDKNTQKIIWSQFWAYFEKLNFETFCWIFKQFTLNILGSDFDRNLEKANFGISRTPVIYQEKSKLFVC